MSLGVDRWTRRPTLSLKYDADPHRQDEVPQPVQLHAGGFRDREGIAGGKAISDAVNELIANGDYAKILDKWGVTSSGIPTSAVNPPSTL